MNDKRKKIKQLEVMVADVVIDTQETTTLILFTGNDLLDNKPGHFLTIDPHQFEALERWTNYLEDKKARRKNHGLIHCRVHQTKNIKNESYG